MATSKMSRQPEADSIDSGASDFFDFGEWERIPVAKTAHGSPMEVVY